MNAFENSSPKEVLDHLKSLGKADAADIEQLRKWLEDDWIIDPAEAELLFQVNAAIEEPTPAWIDLFTHSLSRFLVFDMNTPGEVDEEEAQWLRSHLTPQLREIELELLRDIKRHATKTCSTLDRLLANVP